VDFERQKSKFTALFFSPGGFDFDAPKDPHDAEGAARARGSSGGACIFSTGDTTCQENKVNLQEGTSDRGA